MASACADGWQPSSKAALYFEQLLPGLAWEAAAANAHGTTAGSSNDVHGYIAQWLERLTADQQFPGSNPGVPFSFKSLYFIFFLFLRVVLATTPQP